MPALADPIKAQLDAAENTTREAWAAFEAAREKAKGTDLADPENPQFVELDNAHKAYSEASEHEIKTRNQLMRMLEIEASAGGNGNASTPGGAGAGMADVQTVAAAIRQEMEAAGVDFDIMARQLMDSDGYKTLKAAGVFEAATRAPIGGNIKLGQALDRKQLMNLVRLGSAGSAGALVIPSQGGYAELPYRPLTLLDFIPTTGTDSDSVDYVRQLTRPSSADYVAETTNVTPGAEDGLKPTGSISWERVNEPVKTIAELIPATRQALADNGQLQGLLQNELVYDVRRKLEQEIAIGPGTSERFAGLVTDAANSYTRGASDPDENIADAIHRGMTTVLLDDYEVDFVLMNAVTDEKLELMKNANDDYMNGGPFRSSVGTVWGRPKVINNSLEDDQVVVGARRGAQLWLRSGVDVFVSDSHKDWFARNVLALLAELRAAFLVTRPNAFAVVDVTEPA